MQVQHPISTLIYYQMKATKSCRRKESFREERVAELFCRRVGSIYLGSFNTHTQHLHWLFSTHGRDLAVKEQHVGTSGKLHGSECRMTKTVFMLPAYALVI